MTKKGNYIVLLDPALHDNNGLESKNLGDLIISESILKILEELFPSKQILRISTHAVIDPKNRHLINSSYLAFIGGTNLITSDVRKCYRQFRVRSGKLVWLYPGIQRLVLFGCGWGYGYGEKMHYKASFFYRRILHPDFVHSLRDQYSTDKLAQEGGIQTINTSCPTTWSIRSFIKTSVNFKDTCLFTLTDHKTDLLADNELLKIIIRHFSKIIFYPQGYFDIEYLQTLPAYKENKNRVGLLPHSYQLFKEFITTNSLTYIGTRLHAGIKCMENNHKSIIVAIDNRAKEMSKDIFLPICVRGEYTVLNEWLMGREIFNNGIVLPHSNIAAWKNQFLLY